MMEKTNIVAGKKIDKSRIISLEKGKIPPQAVELEEAVLGAMMIDKKGIDDVIDILSAEAFYDSKHQEIYAAIFELFQNSEPIDLLTVSNLLKKNGKLEFVGGDFFLIRLTQKVASSAHIEFHARIILQKFIQRRLISISSEIIENAYDESTDVFDLLDDAEGKLFEVTQGNLKKSSEDAGSLVKQALRKIQEIGNQEGMSGLATGFTKLDALTSGWQPSDLVIIAARPGMGKCLGKGTKVLMFNGDLKKVEDIVEGELLMGDDSTPRLVKSIARGQEKMYWIRQNKAKDYRVNESHILSLKRSRNEGKHKKGDVLNITVKDYLEKSDKFKSNYKGYKVAVDFKEKEVTIPPYFLGIWLGDGHSYSSRITTLDTEIIEYLEKLSVSYNQELKVIAQVDRVNNYAITKGYRGGNQQEIFSLQSELQKLNVIKNKHIPNNYLINSKENRLQILAGLIDSDGHYDDKANCFEIVQKNKKLAKQIKFLCDSLGYRTTFRKKKASIKEIDFETDVYRLRFFGNIDEIPVKIERKKARKRIAKVDWKVTGIQVEYDKVDDYYGFEIDGNRLFLLEDMTVTHNTAFVISMAKNMAIDFNHGVAVFSLEMSSVQLITRMISSETGLTSEKLRKGNLEPHEWEQLNVKVKKLSDAPIFIDDTPSLSIFDLRAKARRLVSQHNVRIIVIDYLQLMTAGGKAGGNREQEISMISRNLKALAKELEVPVIALSQLSRAVETRGGSKRPLLSDLRESGAIEQDADIVSFIFRPEYYGMTEWDDDEHTPCEGQGEFIVAKHRNGGLDNIRLKFTGHLAKFSDLEEGFNNNLLESSMNTPLLEEGSKDYIPNGNVQDSFGIGNELDNDNLDDNGLPF